MSGSNGFRIRGLNQDANRVSVQSNVQTTWMLTRRKWDALLPKWHDVGIAHNELIVIKCQDGAASAEIELEPLGDRAGTLIADSSRKAAKTLRVNQKYVFTLEPGEAIILRNSTIVHPSGPGAGLSV